MNTPAHTDSGPWLLASVTEGDPDWTARKAALDSQAQAANDLATSHADRIRRVRLDQPPAPPTYQYWAHTQKARDRFRVTLPG